MEWLKKRRRAKPAKVSNGLETPAENKERWRSIYIIYFTMFLMSLGFSIVLTGVWPYLDKLDPKAGKEFMGFIVAANPLAQMIFSPIFGWWGNRLGSIRLPLLLSVALFTLASAMYSSLEIFDEHRKYWMLVSRFLVGVSSANVAVCRSYISAATTVKERTGVVSMVSLAQVLGFIVGPALQAAVTPLGDQGVPLIPGVLSLDMYTAAGWMNVALGIGNLVLFLPAFFTERQVAAKEAMVNLGTATEEETWKSIKPDYLASWTLIIAFFVLVFNFVLLETLATVLIMDQFALTKAEALYYMGLMMSVGAIIACVTFAGIGPLCKRFLELKVLLWGGFFFMVIGRAVHIPWGSEPPLLADYNITNSTSEVVGCPPVQEWCTYVNAMTLTQFILGYIFTSIGYPLGVTLIQTVFSKILGPRPQGTWMGIMTGAGCCSRFMGPVFVSYIYVRWGTVWTFGITTAMMAVAMVWLHLMMPRLRRLDPGAVATGGEGESFIAKRPIVIRSVGDDTDLEMVDGEKQKFHETNGITIVEQRES